MTLTFSGVAGRAQTLFQGPGTNWILPQHWTAGLPNSATTTVINSGNVVLLANSGGNPYEAGWFYLNGGSLEVSVNGRLRTVQAMIAPNSGQTASALLSDSGAVWTITRDFGIGGAGTGTFTIRNGATLNLNAEEGTAGVGDIYVGNDGGSGTLNIGSFAGGTTGGTINFAAGNQIYLGSSAGNGWINFNQTDTFTLNAQLYSMVAGKGVLTQRGTGTTIVNGDNSTFTGSTTVASGTLRINGAIGASSFSVSNSAVLEFNTAGNVANTADTTFFSVGTVRKTGTGSLAWTTGAATFAMASGSLIDVQAGTFTGGSNANDVWTNNRSDLNVAAGATFAGFEANVRVDALTGGGTITAGWGGSGSLTFGVDNGSGSFSGVLANGATAGNYTKTGTGRQTLTGNNTYTGSTNVVGGTLALSGTTASPAFAIASGAVLELGTSATLGNQAATTFTGTGTLRKTGTGTVAWTAGAATFALGSGALIDVQGGTLTGGSSANEVWTNNRADLNVAAGATFEGVEADVRVDALTGTGTIRSGYGANQGSFTFGVDNGSGSFGGVLADGSAPGRFIKMGAGTQTLTGSNTFTGGLTLSDGMLAVGSAGALGSTGTITFAGGTLQFSAGNTTDYSGRFSTAANQQYRIDTNGRDVTLASALTSLYGSLVKSGSGTLTLTGVNDYGTGESSPDGLNTIDGVGTLVTGGTLAVGTNHALGTTASSSARFGPLTLAGGTLRNTASFSSVGRPMILGAGGGTVETPAGTQLIWGGAVEGNGALTKTGAGTLSLDGINTHTGATTISAGILSFGTARSAPIYRDLKVEAGATALFLIGGGFPKFDRDDIPGILSANFQAGSWLGFSVGSEDPAENSASLGNVIAGVFGLAKYGRGELELTGANTYAGGTLVAEGTLVVSSPSALGGATSALTLKGGLLGLNVDSLPVGAVNFAGGDAEGNTLIGASYTGTVAGSGTSRIITNLAGSGGLTMTGSGLLILGGTNTYTGSHTTGPTTNTYTGPTTISAGTVVFNTPNALPSISGLSVAAGATAAFPQNILASRLSTLLAGTAFQTGSLLGIFAEERIIGEVDFPVVIRDANGGANSIGFVKLGDESLVLTGRNTYTGPTIVRDGELRLGATQVISDASVLTMEGGLLRMFYDETVGGLSGSAGYIELGGRTLTVNQNTNSVFSADIVRAPVGMLSSGRLTKTGTGTLTLAGRNAYSGVTTVAGGRLQFAKRASYYGGNPEYWQGNMLAVSSGAMAAFNVGGPDEFLATDIANLGVTTSSAGSIGLDTTNAADGIFVLGVNIANSLFRALTKLGPGTLILTSNNGYTDGTTVQTGKLQLGDSGTVLADIGAVTVNAGATLRMGQAGETIGSLAGAGTVDLFNGTGRTLTVNQTTNTTFTGLLTGSGSSLVKTGSGTLTLAGTHTFTGSTTVSAGRLLVNSLLDGTPVYVGSGATLGGSGRFGDLVTFASGAHLAPGNSPGTTTFSDGLTLGSGTILDFELGTVSDLIRVSGGTLAGPAGTGGLTLNLTNAGGFAPATYTLFDFSGATLSDFSATDFTLGTRIAGYDYSFALTGSTLQLIATASAIPEPSTYALLAGAGALTLGLWRRRRRREPAVISLSL